MKIDNQVTDGWVLAELGRRLAKVRLDRNVTQVELAKRAGVSKRTVERLESGAVGVQLSCLIRICRALDLLTRFEAFIPEPVPSPIVQLKLRGKERRRASSAGASPRTLPQWTWGDRT